MGFELDPSYKDVPQRIADFKAKHPEGCLRPVNQDEPYRIEAIDGRFFITYVAAAYRSPEDSLPGIGVAYEPFPGKTPYTRDSELQNAETSAWGRAIVAALASESKAVASAEDIRNRKADAAEERADPELDKQRAEIKQRVDDLPPEKVDELKAWVTANGLPGPQKLTYEQVRMVTEWLDNATADTDEPELPEVSNENGKKAANEAYQALEGGKGQ